jgi:predicted Ser/Thr protein kinase
MHPTGSRQCPKCSTWVRDGWRVCPACAQPLGSQAETEFMPASSSSRSSDEGRFQAGAVLGERYRVLGLLGRGGMGEVYRALDLKLDQAVALKFLPPAMARDQHRLERFRGEVRIARKVSHRNVCRVYDLGEIDGAPFLSMEYIDGEDLGSLLRRIGRLPGDKAIEFARRLCAGLAAAHEKGVLHRDLKPANIMIDGRGQVIIMDFGLAVAIDGVAAGDIRSGTPDYMAPEQQEGREVTVRSDIYSLGLVLSEMFTGQKASRASGEGPLHQGKLNIAFKDIDPAVEKVIQRCLDSNPAKRPQSALDVSRALPGGDPLAEALAAGDTPSPQMVAASEDTGVLSVPAAVACVGIVVAGLAVLVFWGSRYNEINLMPMPYSPEVLRQKAHEIEARFGYADTPLDETHQFTVDPGYVNWMLKTWTVPAAYRAQVAREQPALLRFRHTDSPAYLVPIVPSGVVSLNDPPRLPGTIDMDLDPQGRLLLLRVISKSEAQTAESQAPVPLDWNKLFEAAGLDPSSWTPAEPREVPPVAFDERKAWTQPYSSAATFLRIEAAGWRGKPVYFELFGPWRTQRSLLQQIPEAFGLPGSPPSLLMPIAILLVAAVFFAVRNFRAGRGDSAGALRLACFVLICGVLSDVLTLHHTPSAREIEVLANVLAASLLAAAITWTLYMALEPYVRRKWPQALIGWTRALSGNLRDPLVAGHMLAGLAAGLALGVVTDAELFLQSTGWSPPSLEGLETAGSWIHFLVGPPVEALGYYFAFLLLRLILRKNWIALVALLLLIVAGIFSQPMAGMAKGVVALAVAVALALYATVAIRFGMLAVTAMLLSVLIRPRYPLTANFSAWFAPECWMTVGLTLGVALWCFRNALGGRKVWKGDLLEG